MLFTWIDFRNSADSSTDYQDLDRMALNRKLMDKCAMVIAIGYCSCPIDWKAGPFQRLPPPEQPVVEARTGFQRS